jgi:hypothetical protein
MAISRSEFESLKEGDIILSLSNSSLREAIKGQKLIVVGKNYGYIYLETTHLNVGVKVKNHVCDAWGIERKHLDKLVIAMERQYIAKIVKENDEIKSVKKGGFEFL